METYLNINYRENNKKTKKVSCYRDKNGTNAREMQECIAWVNDNLCVKHFRISDKCYNRILEELDNKRNKTKKEKRRRKSFKNYSYIKTMLNTVITKNKYELQKSINTDNEKIYKERDVYEFLLLLSESVRQRKLQSFLDVPDVFYITRQVKKMGLEFYGLK